MQMIGQLQRKWVVKWGAISQFLSVSASISG
jgi:hypothetical protein